MRPGRNVYQEYHCLPACPENCCLHCWKDFPILHLSCSWLLQLRSNELKPHAAASVAAGDSGDSGTGESRAHTESTGTNSRMGRGNGAQDPLWCHQRSRWGRMSLLGGVGTGGPLWARSLCGERCWPSLPLWQLFSNVWLVVLYF